MTLMMSGQAGEIFETIEAKDLYHIYQNVIRVVKDIYQIYIWKQESGIIKVYVTRPK